MSSSDEVAKVAKLLKDFRIGMLVTTDETDTLTSRPMALQEVEFDGDLWFFAERSSRKVAHVRANPRVGVALASNDAWVSLSGTAEIVDNAAKTKELWNSAVEAWFPNGQDDPNVVLIKIHADGAEYWDAPGSRLSTALAFVKAKATGKQPDVGENERVDL